MKKYLITYKSGFGQSQFIIEANSISEAEALFYRRNQLLGKTPIILSIEEV